MMRKTAAVTLVAVLLTVTLLAPADAQGGQGIQATAAEMVIPAVGTAEDGSLFGVASTLRVTMQTPGSGNVFVSAQPVTQMDLQVSARLAVKAAGEVTSRSVADKDFTFAIQTPATIIGGPSAGGAMAVAATALLMGWEVDPAVAMTGMINPDGSVGPVGGILQKVDAAAGQGAETFVVPTGQGTVMVTRQQVVDQDGMQQVRTVQEPVDVAAYAKENHDITVLEATDLYEAVAPFTGHRLVRPQPSGDPLDDPRYREATGRLATQLVGDAEARLENTTQRIEQEAQGMSDADEASVASRLESAGDLLGAGREAAGAGNHYLAASRAFEALVAVEHADGIIGFHATQGVDIVDYTQSYVERTQALVEASAVSAGAQWPVSLGRLDSVAAAQIRHHHAQAQLDLASAASEARNFGQALEAAAFARQRAASVGWWAELGNQTDPGSQAVSRQAVESLVAEYAGTVELHRAYANLILGENGGALDGAAAAHQRARSALAAERPAAALFELVEALAQTNTALVSIAGPQGVEARLDILAEAAAYEVQLAASLGSSPVLAQSLTELADSARHSDPAAAYALYSNARMAARALLAAAGLDLPEPGVEPYRPGGGPGLLILVKMPGVPGVLVLAVAAAVTGVAGVFIAVALRDESRPPRRPS